MPAHESLRIRTPPPDSQEEESDEQIKKTADRKARNIPTIIMATAMINLLVYIYTSNEMNLYFAVASGFIWIMFLFDSLHDKNAWKNIHYTMPKHAAAELDSGV